MPTNNQCYNRSYNGTTQMLRQPNLTASTDGNSIFTQDDNKLHRIVKKIEHHFGKNTTSDFYNVTKSMKKLTVSKCQLKFLLKCRNYDIFPRHMSKLCKSINNISFHSNLINKKASHTTEYIKKKLHNLEIRDINIHIKSLNNSINSQLTKLKASTSETITDEFLKYYENTLTYFQYKHSTIHTKKFNGLLQQ